MTREHVHLIGIGGTGMTALAGLLQAGGCRVTGSDRALYPPTSLILERLGLEVFSGFDPAHLEPVRAVLADEGIATEIAAVPYEFQRGGNEMLVVRPAQA